MIKGIRARLDAAAVGFQLQVYVECSLADHDDRANARFEEVVKRMPNIVRADWVTGETLRVDGGVVKSAF